MVVLNEDLIRERILPELVQRYFAGPDGLVYDVAIINHASQQSQVIYATGPLAVAGAAARGDARLDLLAGLRGPYPVHRRVPGSPANHARALPNRNRGSREASWPPVRFRLAPLHFDSQGGRWELVARHRKGSLDAALASLRRRHLAISFGVLLVLALTMAMIVIVTRRAQLLAKLQMDFVAGVSHELRTPLAVIASAADNIADGIVDDRTKLLRYGEVIRKHARYLTHLVEQILLFSATGQNRYHYNFTLTSPKDLVEVALGNCSELIRSAGFTVERNLRPGLKEVWVDRTACSGILQNLITNAVKYGGEARWMGVSVVGGVGEQSNEICFAVQDRGAGIEASELQRIFDPFYRGRDVVAAQVRGTGLGLAIARKIAEDMGGRLTVTSESGKGSTFRAALTVCRAVHRPFRRRNALPFRHIFQG